MNGSVSNNGINYYNVVRDKSLLQKAPDDERNATQQAMPKAMQPVPKIKLPEENLRQF